MWSIPGLKAAGIVSATATKDDETGVSAAEHPPWELARFLAVLTTLRDRPRIEAEVIYSSLCTLHRCAE
jgi:hypothetical protein